jgi:hypothetical protein
LIVTPIGLWFIFVLIAVSDPSVLIDQAEAYFWLFGLPWLLAVALFVIDGVQRQSGAASSSSVEE